MEKHLDEIDPEIPLAVDPARQKLSTLNYPEASLNIGGAHAIELVERAKAAIKSVPDLLEGPAASSYLEKLIPVITQAILDKQNPYSSVRWLWYLRRLPREFFGGDYSTTIGYDRGLAESLSWFSTGSDAAQVDQRVAFKVDDSAIRHVSRYLASVKMLSHLQIVYRRIGKGASLDTRPRVPLAETPSQIDEAIRIYDTRHDNSTGSMLQGLGLSDVESDTRVLSADLERLTGQEVYLIVSSSPHLTSAVGPDETGLPREQRLEASHAFKSIPLNSLLYPFGRSIAHSLPFVSSAEPLILLLMMFPIFATYVPWVFISALQVGYFIVRDEILQSIVDQWLPRFREVLAGVATDIAWSANYAEWRMRLDSLVPETWPLRAGGVIRPYHKHHLLLRNA